MQAKGGESWGVGGGGGRAVQQDVPSKQGENIEVLPLSNVSNK